MVDINYNKEFFIAHTHGKIEKSYSNVFLVTWVVSKRVFFKYILAEHLSTKKVSNLSKCRAYYKPEKQIECFFLSGVYQC